jgi:hypothetical protein
MAKSFNFKSFNHSISSMKYLLSLMAVLLTAIPTAQASGLQVSPSRLELTAAHFSGKGQELTVANPTQEALLLQITTDEFEDLIEISQKSLVLEAGARKTVAISVNPETAVDYAQSTLSTNLSIVARPLADSGVAINTGIKLPLTVSLQAGNGAKITPGSIAALAGAILAFLVGLSWLWLCRRPKAGASAPNTLAP